MAKKQRYLESKKLPTSRQLSKRQRQQRIQRIIMIVGSLFFVFVLGYVGYGYYTEQVRPFKQPVMRVNETVFDMDYYIKVLDIWSLGQEPTAVSAIANMVVDIIEQSELIKIGAAQLGIGISDEEVKSQLERLKLPNEKVYRDTVIARLLAAKLLKDQFEPKVPTSCEQAQVKAMFLENKDVANQVIDRLAASGNFTALAEEFSVEAITKEKGGELGWLPKGFAKVLLGDLGDSKLEDIVFGLEPGRLSEPVYDKSVTKGIGYWLIQVTEKDEKKGSHAKGILLGNRQEAEEIRARIEAGEDFGALAKEYSQDSTSKESGGDLGWTQGEIINRVVMAFALKLEPGTISQPAADSSVETKGGYWLVKVVDKDASRQLDDTTRGILKAKVFEDWLEEQRGKNSIEKYLSEEQKFWAVTRVLKNRGQ